MLGGGGDPVRVKIINTQYVESDVMSFKSVVQRLTGIDAVVPTTEESSINGGKLVRPEGIRPAVKMSCGYSMLSRDFSFRDIDRLVRELSPLDELQWLCDAGGLQSPYCQYSCN